MRVAVSISATFALSILTTICCSTSSWQTRSPWQAVRVVRSRHSRCLLSWQRRNAFSNRRLRQCHTRSTPAHMTRPEDTSVKLYICARHAKDLMERWEGVYARHVASLVTLVGACTMANRRRTAFWSLLPCLVNVDHEQLELFPKRGFRCDCPTTDIVATCTLHRGGKAELPNAENVYGQNFQSRFCR